MIDIREFRAEELMRSSKPAGLALAMLAAGGPERFDEILRRAAHLPRAPRSRVLAQMTVLSGLCGLAGRLKMELRSMRSVMIDIADNEIIREFMEDAKAEGLKEGRTLTLEAVLIDLIRGKFGSVPRWASARISAAKLDLHVRERERLVPCGTVGDRGDVLGLGLGRPFACELVRSSAM